VKRFVALSGPFRLEKYLDQRPIVVAIAGPNGAGKTTFYRTHLQNSGLRFVNADVLTQGLNVDPYEAAKLAATLRDVLIQQRGSFVFETVFSDPAGDKLAFLKRAVAAGYGVVLCFIGLESTSASEARVAMRVSQGGHDVPRGKLVARFPRTLANLKTALREIPVVMTFDNSDLRAPFRHVLTCEMGQARFPKSTIPKWLRDIVPGD
jgi:predicted ABC-type ATPase